MLLSYTNKFKVASSLFFDILMDKLTKKETIPEGHCFELMIDWKQNSEDGMKLVTIIHKRKSVKFSFKKFRTEHEPNFKIYKPNNIFLWQGFRELW